MKSLKTLTTEYTHIAIANSVIDYIQQFKDTNTLINTDHINELLQEIKTQLKNRGFDFSSQTCKYLNNMFEQVIDFIPAFDIDQLVNLTDIFHTLEYAFIQAQTNNKDCKFIRAFEPELLFNLFDSPKIDELSRERFIQSTILNRVRIQNTGRSFKQQALLLNDSFFENISLKDKHRMISDMVYSNKSNSDLNNWVIQNLEYLSNVICNENHSSLGQTLFLDFIPTTLLGRTDYVFTVDEYGWVKDESGKNRIPMIMYVDTLVGHPMEYLPYVEQIRAHMCGGMDRYKTLYQMAETLGCTNDILYWTSVLNNQPAQEMSNTSPIVEF